MTKTQTRTNKANGNHSADVEAVLEQLAVEQAQVAERIAALRAQILLARGTGDVTAEARVATAPEAAPVEPPLAARVEAALRRAPIGTEALCREVHAPAGPVTAALKRLRTAKRLYNVGSEDRPMWTLVIGDEVPTAEAYAKVWQLIALRPFEAGELVDATGIRSGRVQGALVDAQRLGGKVINAGGTKHRWRWFLVKAPKVNGHGAR